MTLLDLGCGWGSLTCGSRERYPSSRILAVSNSRTQRELDRALAQLPNVEVRHRRRQPLELEERFDRILSVELLEHMRNYEALLGGSRPGSSRTAGSSATFSRTTASRMRTKTAG